MRPLVLGVALAALLAAAGAAGRDQDRVLRLKEAGDILPLEAVLERARRHAPGTLRLLEAELEGEHGRYVYELEVVDERGVVSELKLDARTGEPVAGD